MPPTTAHHQLAASCDVGSARHKHDYRPPADTTQRCSCGHTRFSLNVGGAMSPAVVCAKCGTANRTATAWIRGYYAGVTEKDRQAAL